MVRITVIVFALYVRGWVVNTKALAFVRIVKNSGDILTIADVLNASTC